MQFEWSGVGLPLKIVRGLKQLYRDNTLPEKVAFRFEDASGGLWGGLDEPMEVYGQNLFWGPSETLRLDLFKRAWNYHRIKVAKAHDMYTSPDSPEYSRRLIERFGPPHKLVVLV